MCFMDNTYEDQVSFSSDNDSNTLFYDELEYGFKNLLNVYYKLSSKCDKIKKLNTKLNDENDCLLFYNDYLKCEVSELKKIVSSYNSLSIELIDLRKKQTSSSR